MNLRPLSRTMRNALTAAIAATTLLGVSACGPSLAESQSGGEAPAADSKLAEMLPAASPPHDVFENFPAAFAAAEKLGDPVLVAGSLYLVGEARALLTSSDFQRSSQ